MSRPLPSGRPRPAASGGQQRHLLCRQCRARTVDGRSERQWRPKGQCQVQAGVAEVVVAGHWATIATPPGCLHPARVAASGERRKRARASSRLPWMVDVCWRRNQGRRPHLSEGWGSQLVRHRASLPSCPPWRWRRCWLGRAHWSQTHPSMPQKPTWGQEQLRRPACHSCRPWKRGDHGCFGGCRGCCGARHLRVGHHLADHHRPADRHRRRHDDCHGARVPCFGWIHHHHHHRHRRHHRRHHHHHHHHHYHHHYVVAGRGGVFCRRQRHSYSHLVRCRRHGFGRDHSSFKATRTAEAGAWNSQAPSQVVDILFKIPQITVRTPSDKSSIVSVVRLLGGVANRKHGAPRSLTNAAALVRMISPLRPPWRVFGTAFVSVMRHGSQLSTTSSAWLFPHSSRRTSRTVTSRALVRFTSRWRPGSVPMASLAFSTPCAKAPTTARSLSAV